MAILMYLLIPGWDLVVDNLNKVPVISLALGPVAGLGAARLVSSHFSLMVKELSQVFVAGPPLVKKIGENVTKEELGGYNIHSKNGVIDNLTFPKKKQWIKLNYFYLTCLNLFIRLTSCHKKQRSCK